ncbi:MAG: hypothetical protein HGB19_01850 [Chlorobiales bacterium]|nr:hypothetical protein [Chlorobiales bacterium]
MVFAPFLSDNCLNRLIMCEAHLYSQSIQVLPFFMTIGIINHLLALVLKALFIRQGVVIGTLPTSRPTIISLPYPNRFNPHKKPVSNRLWNPDNAWFKTSISHGDRTSFGPKTPKRVDYHRHSREKMYADQMLKCVKM